MLSESETPTIYFHVGLGKVASTYLQYRFFPKLHGIYYIQRTKYQKATRLIQSANHDKYLLSREFDRQLEEQVAAFGSFFPHTKPILLLRRHDEWLASQYRRHVKNGSNRSLKQFVDIEQDNGYWRINDLYFMPKIRAMEKAFTAKPLVLFYDDFTNDPFAFFNALATYMNVDYDKHAISLQPFHTSYNDKQLKVMRKWGSRLFQTNRQLPRHPFAKWIARRAEMMLSYTILYGGLMVPASFVEDVALYPKDYLERVRLFYQDDWQQCIDYARANNPPEIEDELQPTNGS